MTKKVEKPGRAGGPLDAWRKSAQWRAISREAISGWNKKRATMPRCGAKCRTKDETCQNLPRENGRCRFHGGATPSGDKWHRRQWTGGDGPATMKRMYRKLAWAARDKKKLEHRLATMTPEERARYDAWHCARQPGVAAERKRAKDDRKLAAELAAPRPARPPSPEAVELQAMLAALEAERDRVAALLTHSRVTDDEGIFG